jgi:hypothetical protein
MTVLTLLTQNNPCNGTVDVLFNEIDHNEKKETTTGHVKPNKHVVSKHESF